MRVATHFPVFERDAITDMTGALTVRARERPDALACLLLEDGEREGARLTYADLDVGARRVARWLEEHTAPGSRVLLSFPAGVEFLIALFGCFAAGVIAVPAPTLRGTSARARIASMAADCGAALALTTTDHAAQFKDMVGLAAFSVRECLDAEPRAARTRASHRVAFLQYTSGSTGAPKGVIISHRALWANEAVIRTCFGHEEGVILVGWLPNFQDMGLVGNLLQPIYAGGLSVILPPAAFTQRPLRWLRAIARYRAHTSGAPNFAYDLCVRAAERGDIQPGNLDLSSWRVAFNGAEPVRAATLEAIARRFADDGFDRRAFMPCYGLAESTLMVAGAHKGAGASLVKVDGARGVACGAPVAGAAVRIVDPESGAIAPEGAVGEILVGGDSLCDGYWNKEDVGLFQRVGDDTLLRTGDLGAMTPEGLVITGRLKDVMILHGRKVHPADIEALVEAACGDLGVTRALVVGVDGARSQEPFLFAEISRTALRALAPEPIVQAARRAAGAEAPLARIILMKPGALPLTSSGKVRRSWCRDAFLAGELAGVAWCDTGAAARRDGHAATGEQTLAQ